MRVKESITKFIEGKLYPQGEQGEDGRPVCVRGENPRYLHVSSKGNANWLVHPKPKQRWKPN